MNRLKFPNEVKYVDNKDFKSIIIKIMFPYERVKENLALNSLIVPMISYMTKNYPNEDLLNIEKKKRYLLGSQIINDTLGKNSFLSFEFIIPDDSCLKDNYFEKQFELMEEIIYNPKVNDGKFDEVELEREIINLNKSLDSIDVNMRAYQHNKLLNIVDDEGILTLSLYNNRELIEKVNSSNLYNNYKEIINTTPLIFVFGNVNKKEFNYLFNKYIIKNKDKEIIINNYYDNYLNKIKKKYNYVHEKKEFRDSSLSFVYKIKDYSREDFKYLSLLKRILISLSTRVLDNKLRSEHDLVYGSSCHIYKHYGLFEISTYINKNNKDIVFDKVLEVMEELKDIDYITPLINKVIEGERIANLKRLDLKYGLFDDYVSDYLEMNISQKKLYDLYLKIKPKELIDFINRLCLDTVYFLEEGDFDD